MGRNMKKIKLGRLNSEKILKCIAKVGYIMYFLSKPMIIAVEMILLSVFIFFYYKG